MTARLREVLPRDGFQDHEAFIPTDVKVAVLKLLHAAGCRWIEVTSFVHPQQLPQFVDADEVAAAAVGLPDLLVSAFVPNRRGLERAVDAGVGEVSLAIASTDELARSNFRRDRETVLKEVIAVAADADAAGVEVSVTIGGAWGCPFEGAVAPERVLDIARAIRDGGVRTVLLADTIGAGEPTAVGQLVERLATELPDVTVGIHIHGRHGARSVEAALAAGATVVDTSLGGLGGCPFVPDAPGNVDTAAIWPLVAGDGEEGRRRTAELHGAAQRIRTLLGAAQDA